MILLIIIYAPIQLKNDHRDVFEFTGIAMNSVILRDLRRLEIKSLGSSFQGIETVGVGVCVINEEVAAAVLGRHETKQR